MRFRRLIFVPGYGLSADSWDPLLRHLGTSVGLETVRYEYQNYFRAPDEGSVSVIARMADRLRLDLADSRSTLVVARSMGTAVLGAALSANPPGVPAGVVTLCGLPGPEQMSASYAAIADDLQRTHQFDDRMASLSAETSSARALVAAQLSAFPLELRQALASDVAPPALLRSSLIPWLLIVGKDDRMLASAEKPSLEHLTTRGSISCIDGGHAVHLDNPEGTADAIHAWEASL